MHAKETTSDWTEAKGSTAVHLYTAPGGWKIVSFSPSSASGSYVDTDHDYDYIYRDLCTFKVKGDTGGNDICNATFDDTHVIVQFKTIKVRICRQ
jgi:hypothetical protein